MQIKVITDTGCFTFKLCEERGFYPSCHLCWGLCLVGDFCPGALCPVGLCPVAILSVHLATYSQCCRLSSTHSKQKVGSQCSPVIYINYEFITP